MRSRSLVLVLVVTSSSLVLVELRLRTRQVEQVLSHVLVELYSFFALRYERTSTPRSKSRPFKISRFMPTRNLVLY